MNMMRFVALCALIAIPAYGLAQQLEEYTPLVREKWIQEEQPLQLKVSGGITYDSNLFRLSDEVDAQSVIGTSDKSDIIYRLGAGGKYELRQSRQKFIAEANVTEYRFRNFDDLDNTSSDLRGEWQWQVGNDWSGQLGDGTGDAEWIDDLNERAKPYKDWRLGQIKTSDLNNFCENRETCEEYAEMGMQHAPPIVIVPSS
jgi:hypothetical protein